MSTTTNSPAANRWVVLWASVAVLMCTGAIYSFSVFAKPLTTEHGWTMPQVMVAFTINAAVAPIPMILGGFIADKGGSRVSILAGGLLFATGFVLTGTAHSTTMLYVSYGLIAGFGQGIAYSGCLSNTLKFFPDKRGTAAGLITGGMGTGSVIAALVAERIIDSHGVSTAFVAMGSAYALIVPVASLFIRVAPVDHAPRGQVRPAASGGMVNVPWTGMLRSSTFYFIFFMLALGAFSGLMIASQASPIGQDMFGLSAATAAVFVSVYSACNALGRIVWGTVSDRLGYTNALMLIYGVVALSLLVVVSADAVTGFAVGIIGLGLCFGGVMGVFPALVMQNFGPRFQGTNYGITFVAYSLSAFFAPKIAASWGESHGGNFTVPFVIAIVLALVGLTLTAVFAAAQRAQARSTVRPAADAVPQ